ncbi:transglycosylase SLT domain-containing protein [Hydrogenophaga defluvii]|uniref:Transglycosylase SLT domain-containing protein n=1 Tax=Hydrogenophaga defluvii TaxID=249410 RepID=A0ABW2SCH5_9BURK
MTAQTSWPRATLNSLRTFADDVTRGFFDITHNSLALLGMVLAVGLMTLTFRADLRTAAEEKLLGWLLERQSGGAVIALTADPTAVDRATALHTHELPSEQAKVALWLSRKYRVAPEPLSALVAEAFELGKKIKLDPSLLLAVMAVESSFNPFAQSSVGAQGLMQVMTRVHTDKYAGFGGKLAAFDPVTNLRVGAQVLSEYVRLSGSVEGGLRLYVGAVSSDGSDYIDKVLAETQRIQSVALGRPAPAPVRTPPRPPPDIIDIAPAAPLPTRTDTEAAAELAATVNKS